MKTVEEVKECWCPYSGIHHSQEPSRCIADKCMMWRVDEKQAVEFSKDLARKIRWAMGKETGRKGVRCLTEGQGQPVIDQTAKEHKALTMPRLRGYCGLAGEPK